MFIRKNGKNGKMMTLYQIMKYEAMTKNYELVPHGRKVGVVLLNKNAKYRTCIKHDN